MQSRCFAKPPVSDEGLVLTEEQQNLHTCNFSRDDVKQAMMSIPDDKASSLDVYNRLFYKQSWDIIGEEVTIGVLDFFRSEKLLIYVNVTSITLIPKVKIPTNVSDFRPISCFSVLYKCISKILRDKVLLCQVEASCITFYCARTYTGSQKQKCSLLEIDIQKNYDTVSWEFLEEMMNALKFPKKFIRLIVFCVSSPSFFLMINGVPTGFFESKRGLRWGDPMTSFKCPMIGLFV